MHPEQVARCDPDADQGERNGFDRRFPESPQRLEDDGDDHRLDAIKQRRGLRQRAEFHVDPRAPHDDQHRRQDETGAGDDQPPRAGPQSADVDGHLGGVWARDEVGGPNHVEEGFVIEPAPASHHFILHQRNVRRGSTESDHAELEKEEREFAQPRRMIVHHWDVFLDRRITGFICGPFVQFLSGLGSLDTAPLNGDPRTRFRSLPENRWRVAAAPSGYRCPQRGPTNRARRANFEVAAPRRSDEPAAGSGSHLAPWRHVI